MNGHSKKEISRKQHLRSSQETYLELAIHGKNFGSCMRGWEVYTGMCAVP